MQREPLGLLTRMKDVNGDDQYSVVTPFALIAVTPPVGLTDEWADIAEKVRAETGAEVLGLIEAHDHG